MQIELSPMVKNIRASLMFRFLEKAKEMERQGIEIIHLEKGEPEFGPPKRAIEAAKKAMDEGHNILTPSQGIKELRDAIAEDLQIEYGILVDPSKEVAVVPGAKFGVYAAIASVILPGDEVLCLSPFFPPHREIVEMLGGKFVPIPILEEGICRLSKKKFEERLTAKTRLLLLSYPHNPTGWVPTEGEIDLLLDLVEKKSLVVVSDEVYDKIIFNGLKHQSFYGFPNLQDQLVLVNSFSKRFAMTGWRIGYCVGPSNIINGVVRIQQNVTTCANSAAQRAAVVALKEEKSYSDMLARVYGERKDLIIKRLHKIPGLDPIPPKGSLFIFISISKLSLTSTQFVDELLAEENVAITPGVAFGEDWDQYVRISMTEDPQKIIEAMNRLERFVEKRT
jgi:aspartate/methionine/tyrosine aminotransferase